MDVNIVQKGVVVVQVNKGLDACQHGERKSRWPSLSGASQVQPWFLKCVASKKS